MQVLSTEDFSGKTLGNYTIDKIVSSDALGKRYRGHHQNTSQPVQIDIFFLPANYDTQARLRFLTRFQQECAHLTQLHHPSILAIHDSGEEAGYVYLITPHVQGHILGEILRQGGRLGMQPLQEVLKQTADALDYAHQHGVIHGALSTQQILLGEQRSMFVLNFGLTRILGLQGIEEQKTSPGAHLQSMAGTFLGDPASIAPEVVLGQQADQRADIYALGTILYELLTGQPAFHGNEPFAVARQHVQYAAPALPGHIPQEVHTVLQTALARNPDERFQSAHDLAQAFRQAIKPSASTPAPPHESNEAASQLTGPMSIQWPIENTPASDIDPFAWWSTVAATQRRTPRSSNNIIKARRAQARQRKERRQFLTVLAAGGVIGVGLLGIGGFTLLHKLEKRDQPTGTNALHPQQTPTPTAPPSPSPTAQATTAPTATPTPAHTGTVIGATTMPLNSAQTFINPVNGNSSILVHLPDDSFVAYDRACTHEGVAVNYDPVSHELVCPAHNAIFDPANAANVLQGPAGAPLKGIIIRVNTDGTITTD